MASGGLLKTQRPVDGNESVEGKVRRVSLDPRARKVNSSSWEQPSEKDVNSQARWQHSSPILNLSRISWLSELAIALTRAMSLTPVERGTKMEKQDGGEGMFTATRNMSKCGYLFVAPGWDFSNPLNRTKLYLVIKFLKQAELACSLLWSQQCRSYELSQYQVRWENLLAWYRLPRIAVWKTIPITRSHHVEVATHRDPTCALVAQPTGAIRIKAYATHSRVQDNSDLSTLPIGPCPPCHRRPRHGLLDDLRQPTNQWNTQKQSEGPMRGLTRGRQARSCNDSDCRAHPPVVCTDWHPGRLRSADPRVAPDASPARGPPKISMHDEIDSGRNECRRRVVRMTYEAWS
ncbi:Protein outspread [Eufriesea mexicana]|uniref:Protein outspread n=1 Tax=Eufriesea mexicana TaxID=516756 RepID=A0A310SWZ3_9HYME|nr:Protein outspread [Eufriesea mexicana]